jgi:hypothetical protein
VENVGIIYGHLEYLTAIWNALWPLGIFSGHLVYFSQYWYVAPMKIWQPCWIRRDLIHLSQDYFVPLSRWVTIRFSILLYPSILSGEKQFPGISCWLKSYCSLLLFLFYIRYISVVGYFFRLKVVIRILLKISKRLKYFENETSILKSYHPRPRRDSISRPIAPVSSVAGRDDTTRPRRPNQQSHKSANGRIGKYDTHSTNFN